MCLKIDTSIKLRKTNKNGYHIGYKSIYLDNTSSYQNCQLKNGVNTSNRKNKEFTPFEKNTNLIESGYHIFLDIKDALEECNHWSNNTWLGRPEKVIRVYFKPEDIVSTGFFYNSRKGTSKNVVVMKMDIKSFSKIKKGY